MFNVIGSVLQGVLPTMIALAIYYTFADVLLLIQCLIYHRRNMKVDPKHLSPATPLLEATDLWEDDDEADSENLSSSVATASNANVRGESLPLIKRTKPKVSDTRAVLFNLMIVVGVFVTGFLGWYLSSACGGPSHHDDDDKSPDNGDDELRLDVLGQIFGWLCAVLYLGSRLPQILLNFERKSCDGISFLFFLFACLGNLTYVISILALGVTPRYLLVNASWLMGSVGTLLLDGIIFVQFWVYNGVDETEDDEDFESDNESTNTYQAI